MMSGKKITSDMFGTEAYDQIMKDVSPLLWVDEDTVPTVLAYGVYDKFQPYEASIRLKEALEDNNIPHEYIVFEHSGHGLQNDNKKMAEYNEAILRYLEHYMHE